MSDDETPPDDKKKGKKKVDHHVERDLSEPVPKNEGFFLWLEQLFFGEHCPEKLEVRVVDVRKTGERFGALIKQCVYQQNHKPDKEKVVALSNELLHLIQRDCDVQRRSLVYGVYAAHFKREPDYYERYLIRCNPTARYSRDGEPREDEDEVGVQDRFSAQVLLHHERLFALYGTGLEGIVDRLDRMIERQDARIEKQDATIQRQAEMLERAMSLNEEREERKAWSELKRKGAEKALELGMAMAPPLIGQLLGSKSGTSETSESITLKSFFSSVTPEQQAAAFGVYDEQTGELIKPGVLTKAQAAVLWTVSQCERPVDALDELLPDGPHAVSMEQLAALQAKCGLSLAQLAPLQIIFEGRMSKKQTRRTE